MKFIYAPAEADLSIPKNVPYRILTGGLFGLLSVIMLAFALFDGEWLCLLLCFLFGGLGFLLIFFAIRTQNAITHTKTRMPEDILPADPKHPFYSAQCAHCGILIDYQQADLAFRPWFLAGYVDCPCCKKPIRHCKKENVFNPHRNLYQ